LNAKLGAIPLATALTKEETIDCTITQVAPITDLNILGYDNLTFTGTNFPRSVKGNTISISVVDGSKVEKATCNAHTTDSTKLVC
jgi:hypothetical protein